MKINKTLVNRLKELNLTLSSAESFTGGLFASSIVSVPGASKVFKGGVNTYTVEAKNTLINVNLDIVEKYDVVSEEVAKEMATNIKNILHTDIGVSFTGNAGPTTDGSRKKDVGEVYIYIIYGEKEVSIHKFIKGKRNKVRKESVKICIKNLLDLIK